MVAQTQSVSAPDRRLSRLLFALALVVLIGAAAGYFVWWNTQQQIAEHGPSGVSIRMPVPPSLPRGPQMPDPPLPTSR